MFRLPEKQLALVVFLGCLVGLYAYRHMLSFRTTALEQPEGAPVIVIEIEGEVPAPGVYCFDHVPSLREVLSRGGEFLNPGRDVAQDLNAGVNRGSTVLVRKSQGKVSLNVGPMAAGKRILFGIPMDLNAATAEDLSEIPGIGPGISREIITYRNKQGSFLNLEEIKEVRGIGEKKYRRIKKYLTVTQNVS